jgi:MoxR-like ATPase
MQTLEQQNPRVKNVGGVDIFLWEPDVNKSVWVSQCEPLELLKTAWIILEEDPRPMNPILVGPPGCGKTTLGCYAAKQAGLSLYMMNCFNDMGPEDLIITTRPAPGHESYKFDYAATPLTSALINGGVCILDDANRMSGECWSSLISLLDHRRYVESRAAGIKIPAHPEFRFVANINRDRYTEDMPENIESRLTPVIPIGMPSEKDLVGIILANLPSISGATAMAIIGELNMPQAGIRGYSVRNAIDAARLNLRGIPVKEAVECVMRPAGYAYDL